jgi:hypothetical protein
MQPGFQHYMTCQAPYLEVEDPVVGGAAGLHGTQALLEVQVQAPHLGVLVHLVCHREALRLQPIKQ